MSVEGQSPFDNLKRIAAGLVKLLGASSEVVIHDFSRLPHSLVYIEGQVTGRQVGAPITDLVVRKLRREGNAIGDMVNYRTLTRDGRTLKSATVFVRDGDGRVVGALCVNIDITGFLNAGCLLSEITRCAEPQAEPPLETFAANLGETIDALIDRAVAQAGKQPVTMTRAEKIKLVEILEYHGAFLLKGAVDRVALSLGVSRHSVYNYLKRIRQNDSHG